MLFGQNPFQLLSVVTKLAFRYELKENEIDDKRARWVNEKEIKGIEVNGQKQMKMRNTSILFDS